MEKGASLVTTIAQLVTLTGHQGLENLETSQLRISSFLLEAHKEVFRKLEGRGVDPTLLTNSTDYEPAVAWRCLANLAAVGAITVRGESAGEIHERYQGKADLVFSEVRPVTASSSSGPRAGVIYPKSYNQGPSYFGGGWSDDLPSFT